MSKVSVFNDIVNTPLGAGPGEANLQTPFNSRPTSVLVRVKNHSRTVSRKVLKAAVSGRSGGYEPEVLEKYKGMSPEALMKMASEGRDMNVYVNEVKPTKATIQHDGKMYIIPPAKTVDEEPPSVSVPEGVWDLYMGNWERMNGTSAERTAEIQRLATRFSGRENPAMIFDRDGNVVQGYLEFLREEVRPSAVALDRDFVGQNDITEA